MTNGGGKRLAAILASAAAAIATLWGWTSVAPAAPNATPAAAASGGAAKYAPGPLLNRSLAGPLAGVDEIIFAERVSMKDHWYVNFGYYSNDPNRPGYGDGGRLSRLNLRTGRITVL